MESGQVNVLDLRQEIISDSHALLKGLMTGGSLPDLLVLLQRIRANEKQLRLQDKSMLNPELWKFFHEKLSEKHGEAAVLMGEPQG